MADEVKELLASNSALGDPPELRRRMGENGYLFFRNLIDRDLLWDLRLQLLTICQAGGWIRAGTNLADGLADVSRRCAEGATEYILVYRRVQNAEAFHRIAHHPVLLATIEKIVDEQVLVHPKKVGRLSFPQYKEHTTPPHQDFVHFQGVFDTYTCWSPVGDCPLEMGGLAILMGSHKAATVFDHHSSLGAGGLKVDEVDQEGDWVSTDYRIGDTLIFHSLTVHKALPNRTPDRLRISIDNRYQALSLPIAEKQLGPHLGGASGQTWENVYADWTRADLQYYWKTLDLKIIPSDQSRHDQAFAEALRLARQGDDRALPALKQVVKHLPYSAQAKDAMDALRELEAAITK